VRLRGSLPCGDSTARRLWALPLHVRVPADA
jgi:hypothetical protein